MNLSNRNNGLEDAAKKILEGKAVQLDEAAPKTINVPVGAKMQEAKIKDKDRERLDDLISLYVGATDPEADYYYDGDVPDSEEILKKIAAEFGGKIAKDIGNGTNVFHYGRDNNQGALLTYGDATKHRGSRRITKGGKLNKQDATALKKNIKDILKTKKHKLKGILPEAKTIKVEENAIIHDAFLSKNLGKELVLTISSVSQTQRSPGKYGKVWVMTFKGHDKKTEWGMQAKFEFDPKLSKKYKAGDKVKVVLSNKPHYPNITSIEKI